MIMMKGVVVLLVLGLSLTYGIHDEDLRSNTNSGVLVEEKDNVQFITTLISEALGGIGSIISYRDTQKEKISASKVLGYLSHIPLQSSQTQCVLDFTKSVFRSFEKKGIKFYINSKSEKLIADESSGALKAAEASKSKVDKSRPKSSTLENLNKSTLEKVGSEVSSNKGTLAKRAVGTALSKVPGVNLVMSGGELIHAVVKSVKDFNDVTDMSETDMHRKIAAMHLAECNYLRGVVDSVRKHARGAKSIDERLGYETLQGVLTLPWIHRCKHHEHQPKEVMGVGRWSFPTNRLDNGRWLTRLLSGGTSESSWLKPSSFQFLPTPKGWRFNVVRVRCIVQQDLVGNDDVIITVSHGSHKVTTPLGEFNSDDERNDREMFVPVFDGKSIPCVHNMVMKLEEVDNESSDHDFLGEIHFQLRSSSNDPIFVPKSNGASVEWTRGEGRGEFDRVEAAFFSDEDGGSIFTKPPHYKVWFQVSPVYM